MDRGPQHQRTCLDRLHGGDRRLSGHRWLFMGVLGRDRLRFGLRCIRSRFKEAGC